MNIFDEIKEDHKTQRSLANSLLRTEGASEERKKLWKKLKTELEIHAKVEERNFYEPMINHDESQEHARHSIAEHHEIDEMIEKIEETDMGSGAWLEHFKKLKELVFHHLDEEESEIFKVAGKVIGSEQKEKLGIEYRSAMDEEKSS